MPELPAFPVALPGVGVPSRRDVLVSWELQSGRDGAPRACGRCGVGFGIAPSFLQHWENGVAQEGFGDDGMRSNPRSRMDEGCHWAQGSWHRVGDTQTPTLGTRRRVLGCQGAGMSLAGAKGR